MTMFKMRVIGQRELNAALKRLGTLTNKEVQDGLLASGLKVEEHIKRGMTSSKGGLTYKRGNIKRGKNVVGSRFHRASAPGEYPAVDTGRLLGSIAMRRMTDAMGVFVGVNDLSNVKYARYLEFGTSKVAPRPWLRPSVMASKDFIRARMRDAIKDAIVKAGGKRI